MFSKNGNQPIAVEFGGYFPHAGDLILNSNNVYKSEDKIAL